METRVTEAIILAAGRGSRMGIATDDRPKCLVELAGRRLAEWQVAALSAAGIAHVQAVGGYRAEQVAEVLPLLAVNRRWKQTNMVRSLLLADAVLSARACILSYSDIAYRPAHVRALCAAPADWGITVAVDTDWLALWSTRMDDPLTDAESLVLDGDSIVEIGGRAECLDDIEAQFMGLIRVTPRGWRAVRDHLDGLSQAAIDRLDTTTLLARLIRAGHDIRALRVSGGWVEVDSPRDRAAYETAMAEGDWSHDWRPME